MTRKPNKSVVDAGVLLLSGPPLVDGEGEGDDDDDDDDEESVVEVSLLRGNSGDDMTGTATCRVYHRPVEWGEQKNGEAESCRDREVVKVSTIKV